MEICFPFLVRVCVVFPLFSSLFNISSTQLAHQNLKKYIYEKTIRRQIKILLGNSALDRRERALYRPALADKCINWSALQWKRQERNKPLENFSFEMVTVAAIICSRFSSCVACGPLPIDIRKILAQEY